MSRRRLAQVAVLAVAGSLSEGVGLLLLVPILDVAAGPGSGTGAIGGWHFPAFFPHRLDVLLALFVVLVSLRTLIVQARALGELGLRLSVTARLRRRLYAALLAADWRFQSRLTVADLTARAIDAVERAGNGVQYLLALATGGITLAVMFGAALVLAPLPTLVIGAAGAGVLWLHAGLRARAEREGHAIEVANVAFYAHFTRRFGALRLIKSFATEPSEMAEAARIEAGMRAAWLSYERGAGLGQLALQGGAAAVLALAVWLALALWQVPLARLLPLIALCARSVPLLSAVQVAWHGWAHSRAAVTGLGATLAETEAAAEPPSAAIVPELTREIGLDRASVHWSGRDKPAIARLSLTISAREVVALTGPSGAGKSTVADLFGGLLTPDTGSVTIDGVALDRAAARAWRGAVAYVQQEPVLFAGTVRENLAWAAPEADETRMTGALEAAAAGFVQRLPHGLDSEVGDGGRHLSGGERQRIALARALLRDPQLLILDEPTSALDAESEAAIARALAGLRGRLTMLVICHRGALAALADRTIALDRAGFVPRPEPVG